MDTLKAPRPNGMPLLFFQHFWLAIGDEMAEAVLTCLNTGSIPPSINQTFITLIPKVKSLVRVSEYRPITLCNILYKLISNYWQIDLRQFYLVLFLNLKVLFSLVKQSLITFRSLVRPYTI